MVRAKELLISLGILLLCFGAGFLVGHKTHRNGQIPRETIRIDTLTIRDTVVDYKSKEVAIPAGYKLLAVAEVESLNRAVAAFKDSLRRKPAVVMVHDTTYIAVPYQDYTFTDGKTYAFAVNGYDVTFLRHESYQETKVVQVTQPYSPKWQFSPVFSAVAAKDVLGVGAGLKLDLWQNKWQFSPSVGYGLIYAGGGISHGFYGNFSLSYNLIRK